jgi:hypothetical protein
VSDDDPEEEEAGALADVGNSHRSRRSPERLALRSDTSEGEAFSRA